MQAQWRIRSISGLIWRDSCDFGFCSLLGSAPVVPVETSPRHPPVSSHSTSSVPPLYTPDFDQVVRQTLMPKCGVGNGNCHDPSGGMGGLVITDFLPATHEALLVNDRVIPGDPECSLMIRSVEGHPSTLRMPPGSPLSAEERCALIQWVASGAKFQP